VIGTYSTKGKGKERKDEGSSGQESTNKVIRAGLLGMVKFAIETELYHERASLKKGKNKSKIERRVLCIS